MPQRDGTGPRNLGPGTGRGAGHCAQGMVQPNFVGRGWRNMLRLTGLPGWLRFDRITPSPATREPSPQWENDMGRGMGRQLNRRARRHGNR